MKVYELIQNIGSNQEFGKIACSAPVLRTQQCVTPVLLHYRSTETICPSTKNVFFLEKRK